VKLVFLGTGSAFTLDNYQSNMLVDAPGGRLLIDCGGDARRSLAEQGLAATDISEVYVSHLHADHVGGLEWLGLSTYFAASKDDPSRRPLLHLRHSLVDDLWLSLHGGMGTIQGRVAKLDTYFDVRPIARNGGFTFAGTEFRTVQVVHYYDGFEIVPTYGLLFEHAGVRVFLTTDTQVAPAQMDDFRAMADYIFQDCETARFASTVHAHYDDLRELETDVKARMWLYGYQDGTRPDCTKDGFLGWVEKGQVFDLGDRESFGRVKA
jgi:phosphoribosyl 1,2-cyclic phosphodiesterase